VRDRRCQVGHVLAFGAQAGREDLVGEVDELDCAEGLPLFVGEVLLFDEEDVEPSVVLALNFVRDELDQVHLLAVG